MKETMPEKSSRAFTKRFVVVNLVLVWALVILSVIYQQAQFVVPEAMALIGAIFGIYTGIGHLDYRKAAEMSLDRLIKGNADRGGDAG